MPRRRTRWQRTVASEAVSVHAFGRERRRFACRLPEAATTVAPRSFTIGATVPLRAVSVGQARGALSALFDLPAHLACRVGRAVHVDVRVAVAE